MSELRSVDEVVAAVGAVTDSATRVVIGIAGAPGAGKSTIADAVVHALGARAALLPMDGFHLPQSVLRDLGRRDRMGAPDTFDVDGFLRVLTAIRAGEPVAAPGFDRTIEEPVPHAIVIPPSVPIVVVEGNYLLHDGDGWAPTAAALDLALYVEVPHDIRIARLAARHERFGKSPADARAWALGPDESNARLIASTAGRADYVVRLD
ncbi:nucleoside/nucleotide kinase family protein [Galbitalea soli]|uniref:nucleoside/nucleotide kinase family protein n=1 Tax=Galbitalea soli TaxID=1268042 RepID=UPI001798342A|nr:pantothenate kinase [Galbitalea soli]